MLADRLQRIAARLGDGHTRVGSPSKNPNRYPFGIFLDGDSLRLRSVAPAHEAALGKAIAAINDRPVAEVLDGFRERISYDNEQTFRRMTGRLLTSRDAWQSHPCDRPDSVLRLTFSDGGCIELPPCPRGGCKTVSVPRRSADRPIFRSEDAFSYAIVPEKKLCYLIFNQCIDRETYRMMYRNRGIPITDQIERKLQGIPAFAPFLDEMFARMEAEGATALVIDLGRNQGGNSRLCDELISRLQPLAKLRGFISSVRLSPLWAEQYPEPARKVREAFARAGRKIDPDSLYDPADPLFAIIRNRKPDPGKPLFRGRVIVLQSELTYSSAGILSSMIADNGLGTIVGRPSSFSPTHYGDMLSWKLPNTAVSGSVSHKIFHRPDRSRDGERSLLPDVMLTRTWQDYLDGKDIYQQWVLDNL